VFQQIHVFDKFHQTSIATTAGNGQNVTFLREQTKRFEYVRERWNGENRIVYMKDTIKKGLEEDNFFEVLADNMDENRKAFVARLGAEAAETNILECAIVDTIIVPMGEQGKYSIF
jgi:hypothetical protein